MSARAGAALAVAVIGLYVVPAAASAPTFVIQGDKNIGGFSVLRDGSLDGAIGVFGDPSVKRKQPYNFCLVKWPQYGVTMRTYYIGDEDACGAEGCHWTTTITGKEWRTSKGLRIGDPERKLRRLFPKSYRRAGGYWWLISRVFTVNPQPTLQARVVRGRVVRFDVHWPVCGI